MDRFITSYEARCDGDLMIADAHGVAWQHAGGRVSYDSAYYEKVRAYEGSDIAQAVNNGRCTLLARHLSARTRVLDIGAGTGDFVRAAQLAGFDAKGYDIMPAAIERLQAEGIFANDVSQFDAVTIWDTIEHLELPEIVLRAVRKGAMMFVSLPIFPDLDRIRASKHYRPGEHLHYWTEQGFIDWMALYGFRLIERSDHEAAAGRESIGAFAFKRDLPDFHDHLAAGRGLLSTIN
jgi:SAM-dependent methyltransferase